MKIVKIIEKTLKIFGYITWIFLLIISVINDVIYDIQPNNSTVLVLILLYLMIFVKHEKYNE